MKLGEILSKAGAAVIRDVVPGGGLLIDLVNSFLPGEKQLPKNATGRQVTQTINTLSADQKAQIYLKEIDVELTEITSWAQVQSSLAEADKVGASTRPQIALMMAKIVAFVTIFFSTMWIIAIYQDQVDMVVKLSDSWPLMLTIIATPTALLRSYFAMRSKEKKERYGAAVGQPVHPPNFLADIIKQIRG